MKKALFLLLLLTAAGHLLPARAQAIARDEEIESKVEALLSKMTLDEKIGQMLELNLDVLGESDYAHGTFTPNEVLLDSLFRVFKVGSILNAPCTQAWPVEQWREWIGSIQDKSMKYIGIPCIYGLDNNHGVTYQTGGTYFPQPINLAASFNTALAQRGAEICAYETRAAMCTWVYNPVVDLGRDPRWPRIWESFGEDAIVNARMAEAEIKGYQGDDPNHLGKYNVATSIKHYLAYGLPFTGKDRTPALIAPNMLREKYFEPFRAAAMAGALTMMANSSSINGVAVHASWEYLTKWLKEDLDWDGMLVTDWADINNLYQREKVAKDKKDAIRIAINAGIDMSMDPYSLEFAVLLKELVNEGAVSMERIDDAVSRILRLKYRIGLFDEYENKGKADKKSKKQKVEEPYPLYGCSEFAADALAAAEECEVLLKNDGILPLAKGKKILVTGPNANQMRCLNGGWSYSWQGNRTDEFAQEYNTIYEAVCNKYGAENVTLEQGVTYDERGAYYDENEPEICKAVCAAQDVDVIIACVGENSYCETPGNLTDLWLSENQRNLVKALAETGKPIILVLNEGRPRLIADIEPLAEAIIDVLLPGNYGADALVNLMSGEVNFSAKLPYTYPKEINSLATYDYKVSEEVPTMAGAYNYDAKVSLQWPFGYGLSYTDYTYSNMTVSKKEFTADDVLTVTIDVTNSGNVDGKEPILLYSSDLVASIVPDNKRLRQFTKIELKAGETKTVTFELAAKELAFVNAECKWTLEEGDFILKIGDQDVDITCTETKVWDTPNI